MGFSFHWLFSWCSKRSAKPSSDNEDDPWPEPRPHGHQLYPPPPPQKILANGAEYIHQLRYRKYWPPENTPDTPLFCLYRLYEFLVIDDVTGYRNTIEYFCKQRTWAVHDIPDPQDDDPARYAFLACLPALLKAAFNERIKIGLVRDVPAIMSPEQAEAYRTAPESSKTYEEEPEWVKHVKPFEQTLYMESHDGVVMNGFDDPRASDYFKRMNILIWGPHIHFT
ncbi:MAG: hypothetical protein L6R38_004975 [Xanthoria sp. 2 TBL-2021]|nr:MAG: hypothetical protein L6R38_004975 [Xanthoria sp. 2 TBL-2021]